MSDDRAMARSSNGAPMAASTPTPAPMQRAMRSRRGTGSAPRAGGGELDQTIWGNLPRQGGRIWRATVSSPLRRGEQKALPHAIALPNAPKSRSAFMVELLTLDLAPPVPSSLQPDVPPPAPIAPT